VQNCLGAVLGLGRRDPTVSCSCLCGSHSPSPTSLPAHNTTATRFTLVEAPRPKVLTKEAAFDYAGSEVDVLDALLPLLFVY
jgi:hypothetical protein